MAIILLSQQEDNMACLNKKEAHVFLQVMEGLPSQEIAAENGLTLYELIEFKDIIIDKLNQDS
jgi:DNA-binding CsgD family transcriptional regulator